jgi:tungstate transport system substrate-binding protein
MSNRAFGTSGWNLQYHNPIKLMRALLKDWMLLWGVFLLASHLHAEVIRLATTTSTDNSGLFRKLLPHYEAASGDQVQVIAVGTGKALKLGEDGNVDVVLVHAPSAEVEFVESGFGINRRSVMYNDFVLVGPPTDPAEVRGMRQASEALSRIAENRTVFVSRGDDSGTHKKERSLWELAAVKPDAFWYREAGQGMGTVLLMSSELQGYTLTDRGTWLAFEPKLQLEVLVEGDPLLFNPYGIIAVNPDLHRGVNYLGAMRLIAWITSVEGQELIREFTLGGRPLFIPTAISE